MKTLGLINYEGDNLSLKKVAPNKFIVVDQFDVKVGELTLEELCDWIEGRTSIKDSQGMDWYYTYQPQDARVSLFKIINYIMR